MSFCDSIVVLQILDCPLSSTLQQQLQIEQDQLQQQQQQEQQIQVG